jgi:tRNA-Thr(GGU) m(6)t(6)A37 methyltransferase TsaA
MEEFRMKGIGHIRSPFRETAQIPRGLGAQHVAEGAVELHPEFGTGLMDIEGYSHLMILWVFHRSEGYDLVSNPPSDTSPHGVFSTRSPRRPNPIGLTVVELLCREGNTLHVRGVDMLDGTPVLDIKPYTSSIPMEKLRRGWIEEAERRAEKARLAAEAGEPTASDL